jgi:hypothetical protein
MLYVNSSHLGLGLELADERQTQACLAGERQ